MFGARFIESEICQCSGFCCPEYLCGPVTRSHTVEYEMQIHIFILVFVHSRKIARKSQYDINEHLYCPACRTTLIATRFRVAVICPIIQVPHCIRVFFYFVWFVFINHIFQLIMNYVPIVTFWIFTYHKIWILSIMFCFIWSYWIIYFLACLEVSWRVVS